MIRIEGGNLTIFHYKSILTQIYHYTKDNPETQAAMAMRMRGSSRSMIPMLLKHAIQESGHEQLALDDLTILGEPREAVIKSNALPATAALKAWGSYLLSHSSPVAYLGFVYFLEYLPTSQGAEYMQILRSIGVPETAMSFIKDHATVDVHHNKLMDRYLSELVYDEADMRAIEYSIRVTGFLYAAMLQGAIDQVENPRDWGCDVSEISRSSVIGHLG